MRTRPRFAYSVPKIGKGSFSPHRSVPRLLSGRVAPTSHQASGLRFVPPPMPQCQPALTFVENGGRHPRVPRSPPGSYQFPSKLLSNHKTLYENHSLAVYTLALLGTTISVTLSRCAPHPPSEDQRPGFSIRITDRGYALRG
jgi:hypothetical protein